jgi:hypothetical protein
MGNKIDLENVLQLNYSLLIVTKSKAIPSLSLFFFLFFFLKISPMEKINRQYCYNSLDHVKWWLNELFDDIC